MRSKARREELAIDQFGREQKLCFVLSSMVDQGANSYRRHSKVITRANILRVQASFGLHRSGGGGRVAIFHQMFMRKGSSRKQNSVIVSHFCVWVTVFDLIRFNMPSLKE
jgi:hypothetical protein